LASAKRHGQPFAESEAPEGETAIESDLAKESVVRESRPVNYNDPPPPPVAEL